MSAERNPFSQRVAMQLAAVEAELAHPDVSPWRAAEQRQRRRFLLSLLSPPEPIRVRQEPQMRGVDAASTPTIVIPVLFGRRPSHWRWRSAGSIAARVGTALGLLAICTFLWLVILDGIFWAIGI